MVYALITMLVAWSQQLPLLLLGIVVINQLLLQWILMFRAFLQGSGASRADAWFSVLDRVLAIFLCLLLLQGSWFSGKDGLIWFALSQTGGYLFALLLIVINVHRSVLMPVAGKEKLLEPPLNMLSVLRSSLDYALLALLMVGFTRIDALMLQMLHDDGALQAGIYARGFRLLDAGLIFPILMSTLLLPGFTTHAMHRGELTSLAKTGTVVMLLVAIPAALIGFAFANELMHLLNPLGSEARNQAASVLGWLMLAYVPMSLVYVFGTLLTALKQLRLLNIIAMCALGCNILLNLLLIPEFGALGTAWSAGTTQALFCLSCIWFSRSHLESSSTFSLVNILILTGIAAALTCAAAWLNAPWYVQVLVGLSIWVTGIASGRVHPDLHLRNILSGRTA
jgi:O-antigen/teichoic acid export membrane protein